ncbi:MAG: hypothetical protein GY845_11145 [Planctomycetes bacterium]|nr:hypothetical protein [Planctomycetota bacterium]
MTLDSTNKIRDGQDELVTDDDSGGGLFGTNAKIIYEPKESGSYFVVVEDAYSSYFGGYFLIVDQAPPGATPTLPEPQPIITEIDSPFGPMALYESAQYPFSIQYPSHWTEQQLEIPGVEGHFGNDGGESLTIAEDTLIEYGLGEMSLTEYADLVVSIQESAAMDYEIISREEIVTPYGPRVVRIDFSYLNGVMKGSRLVYLHERSVGFNATFVCPAAVYDEEMLPLINYSFDTFSVGDS